MSRARLLHLFDRMERERQDLLRALDVIPPEQLAQQPRNSGWSPAQVITHLAIVEEGALAYMNKKREFKKHRPVGFSSVWRSILLNNGLRLPFKYKAPGIVAEVPATNYAMARSRWDDARARMRIAYTEIPEALIGHDLFKHPFMGRFDLVQAVRFMRRHMHRHAGQIRRALPEPRGSSVV